MEKPFLARLLSYWRITFAIGMAMTLFDSVHVQVTMAVNNGDVHPYSDALLWGATMWTGWALLSPLPIFLSFRFPVERMGDVGNIVLLTLGFAVFAIGNAIASVLMGHFVPDEYWIAEDFLPSFARILTWYAHWSLMSYLALVAATHAIIHSRRVNDRAATQERLRSAAVGAQLTALAKQMQPHFLFNALNALVSMLGERSEAQQFTIRLADMLRVLLRSSQVTATVGEELDLVDAYLAVEQARLGTRLRTDFVIDDEAKCSRLPALMLQPLVENAVTHGISPMPQGGHIRITVRRQAAYTVIAIENSRPEHPAEPHPGGSNLTVGNSRKRLELMYGPTATLKIDTSDSTHYRTIITIPAELPANQVGQYSGASSDISIAHLGANLCDNNL